MIQLNDIVVGSALTHDVLNTLRNYGVVVVNEFLNEDALILLNREFDQMKASADTSYLTNFDYSNGVGKKLLPYKISDSSLEVTKKLFLDDEVIKAVAQAYFNDPYTLNEEIYVVNDVVGTKHHANDLHFDVIPTLKFFLYLTDTDASNGAFYCVPGSHNYAKDLRKTTNISFSEREVTRNLPMENRVAIPIEAPAGTLIIFSTDTFHKAGSVSQGERRVIRGHTREKALKKNLFQKVLARLKVN